MKICLKNQVGGRSKLNEKNFYNFFFFIFTKSHAAIIDYEIEKLIRDYLNLIQTVNNSNKQVNFLIILDENPNAFVNEKRELYITTGLLKYSPSYKALIGVLAHELGHLENFHISKRIDSIKKLRSINQLNSLSIIAASILSNNSDFLLQSMATNQLGIQNYYSAFSKDQEREADTYAAKTLKKLNISSKSLMDFLKFLENRSYKKGSDPDNFMFASHPIYEERFEILRNFSIPDNNLLDKKNEERFNFIKAKLFGFTEKNNQKFDMYLKNKYLQYAESIIKSRNGELKESLILLNDLIKKNQNNIFLIETKADLLLAHGYSKEANKFYSVVYHKYKDNYNAKKRIFETEYEEHVASNLVFTIDFFKKNLDLLIIFDKDAILQTKFKDIALSLNLFDWANYIDANFLLKAKYYQESLKIFNSILENTKDENLKKLTHNKIKLIPNE